MATTNTNLRVGIFFIPLLDRKRDIGIQGIVVPQGPGEQGKIVGVIIFLHRLQLLGKVYIRISGTYYFRNLFRITLAEPRTSRLSAFSHTPAIGITARLEKQYFRFSIRPQPPKRLTIHIGMGISRPVGIRPGNNIPNSFLCHYRNKSPRYTRNIELLENVCWLSA